MSKKVVENMMNEVVVFSPEQKSAYQKVCRTISGSMKSLETSYIKLALALADADSNRLYEVGGYANLYDFAKERYNLSRGTVSKYLGLVSVFGLTEDSKPVYTSSQMLEMLPYLRKGGSVDDFNPDMTIREIRSKIKASEPAPVSSKPARVSHKKEVLFNFPSIEDFEALREGIYSVILEAIEQGKEVRIIAEC